MLVYVVFYVSMTLITMLGASVIVRKNDFDFEGFPEWLVVSAISIVWLITIPLVAIYFIYRMVSRIADFIIGHQE